MVIGGIGSIIMPMITGILADSYGIAAGMAAIVVAAACMVLCVILGMLKSKKAKAAACS